MDCLYADGDDIDTEHMFRECTNLLFVDISKIKISILGHTFYKCEKLKYVFLPKNDFKIKDFSFYCCHQLKLVTNIINCSNYYFNNNFNTSKNLLYFMSKNFVGIGKNNLMCKYFDVSNNFYKNYYPTNESSYIITNKEHFNEYAENDYKGKFLMSQENKAYLEKLEKEEVKKEEDKKKKEEEENEEAIKEQKKTFWEEGIVNKRIVAFEEFKFKDEDFNIVKNENEEKEKTVDQIFYRFVQDEIKEIDDFLKNKMEEWNKLKKNDKTYDNFKKVFVSDYKRKHLFVPEWNVEEENKIIE